jgi:hypothetical protein
MIALHHAMKNYLGHGSALAEVISAVVDGRLVPTGYTNRFRGITGYLFMAQDLRRYRSTQGVEAPPEGFINYSEAAAVLGVKVRDIRGLVARGLICDAVEYQFGLSKLLSAADVQRLAERYVAISALARQSNIHTVSLVRYLLESGTPLLSIPLPDKRVRHAHFLRKDVAAQIQIPGRRLLREHTRRRIVAYRKERWGDHRLARETTSGKPMRRQRRRIDRSSPISQRAQRAEV